MGAYTDSLLRDDSAPVTHKLSEAEVRGIVGEELAAFKAAQDKAVTAALKPHLQACLETLGWTGKLS